MHNTAEQSSCAGLQSGQHCPLGVKISWLGPHVVIGETQMILAHLAGLLGRQSGQHCPLGVKISWSGPQLAIGEGQITPAHLDGLLDRQAGQHCPLGVNNRSPFSHVGFKQRTKEQSNCPELRLLLGRARAVVASRRTARIETFISFAGLLRP